ncbi:MAG TPA: DUF819 family protein [Candidatus Omnitrophota bacterium]|nr:DUF819 family protein [Candidatus Omnitrophota bacterium]
MIQSSSGILAILIFIETLVLFLAGHARTKKFFRFPPSMFWIYFLPMIFSGLNVIPQQSPLYPKIGTYVLPASLILLLISADLKAILKLGKHAMGMMLVGTLGVILGAPFVLFLFKPWLPADAWSGFAVLAASWTGGSANMLAVKEAINTPDSVFLPMVVVDTIVAYSWMGILILLAGFQKTYDAWNHSDLFAVKAFHQKVSVAPVSDSTILRAEHILAVLSIGFLGAFVSHQLAMGLDALVHVPQNTGLILVASTTGILLSLTPMKKLENWGASRIGYVLLYFVLTSIGARANLAGILSAPVLIIAGFSWILIHAVFLLIASRLTRTPLCLVAAASQANIGGPASAPVVAAIYEPALAPVGLLLGIFGNVIGTYCGLLCAALCKWVF